MTYPECHPDQETTSTDSQVVGYYFPPRAKPTKPKNNEGLYVPRNEYFDHEKGNS